ncbi:MAG: hypothetical protein A2942_02515 [Candidatus Lloydbacteria bacterium RIFCSPLOWO2_01_FULL_50_20]|uniref:Uncharacterized protein n=1 Tax=Candidatus Lloydbacteria bacterium RIFCSPLOWO2_01_FULL_50_20 TaxID=1798665 RepID=A0A1G2DGN3_9BACT|nr:MAG: hypothetical protein A3C13_01860 [Candidatus Lloydbacteria bacterium RIFCSPHIGHO2_02_FULL_50_11]OGZ12121.1 MAG: hypothetical protein A2942_02515 [Candidatus Lloydbacteria bacterium RIFCSPLOWO2_01_FULL_50_20]
MLIMSHATLGALGIMAAVWVIAEVLNTSAANEKRIKVAAVLPALFIVLSWISGGILYVFYYAADKAIILKGPWPFAHELVMEIKEHLFFVTLLLALFLTIAARVNDLSSNRGARFVVIATAALIVLTGFAIEGAGATIALGVKMGLLAELAK